MVLLVLHGTTHVTIVHLIVRIPASEIYAKILDPEPELEGAGVSKAQPHEGRGGVDGLQLGPGLVLLVDNGSQVHVVAPAVVQRSFPRLVLRDQRKGRC